MSSALVSFTFNNTKLNTVTIRGKHWTRAVEVCKALEYQRKGKDVIREHVSIENKQHRYELQGGSESEPPPFDWPRNSQTEEYYISEEGLYELLFTSQQPKAKDFRKYCFNVMFPQIRQQLQQAHIEDNNIQHHLVIEEKDTALAILNDDLDESQREYAILEYRYEQLENRAVPYLEDPKKDNGMVVIQKNNGDEYPYIAICGQQGYVAQKIQNKLIDFPNGQIVVLAETPNAIAHYNFLRERGCIEVNPDRVRHFRLGRNLRHQDLLGIQDA